MLSAVLNSPPMFGVIQEKKTFISFHVKFLVSLCNVIIFCNHIDSFFNTRPHFYVNHLLQSWLLFQLTKPLPCSEEQLRNIHPMFLHHSDRQSVTASPTLQKTREDKTKKHNKYNHCKICRFLFSGLNNKYENLKTLDIIFLFLCPP